MNPQTNRKIIVAGGMAAVVGIAAVTFALRSHPVASVAQTPQPAAAVSQVPPAAPSAAEIPTAPAAVETPGAPPAVAQTPAVPAEAAKTPDAPAAVAQTDNADTKSTATPASPAVHHKVAHDRHLAKANTGPVATNGTVTPTDTTADTGEKSAPAAGANTADGVQSPAEPTTTAVPPPAADQKAGTNTEPPDSDSQTTPK